MKNVKSQLSLFDIRVTRTRLHAIFANDSLKINANDHNLTYEQQALLFESNRPSAKIPQTTMVITIENGQLAHYINRTTATKIHA